MHPDQSACNRLSEGGRRSPGDAPSVLSADFMPDVVLAGDSPRSARFSPLCLPRLSRDAIAFPLEKAYSHSTERMDADEVQEGHQGNGGHGDDGTPPPAHGVLPHRRDRPRVAGHCHVPALCAAPRPEHRLAEIAVPGTVHPTAGIPHGCQYPPAPHHLEFPGIFY